MVFQLGNGCKVGIMMGAVVGDASIIFTDADNPIFSGESLLGKTNGNSIGISSLIREKNLIEKLWNSVHESGAFMIAGGGWLSRHSDRHLPASPVMPCVWGITSQFARNLASQSRPDRVELVMNSSHRTSSHKLGEGCKIERHRCGILTPIRLRPLLLPPKHLFAIRNLTPKYGGKKVFLFAFLFSAENHFDSVSYAFRWRNPSCLVTFAGTIRK